MLVEPLAVAVGDLPGEGHPAAEIPGGHFAGKLFAVGCLPLAGDHERTLGQLLDEVEERMKILVGQAVADRKEKSPARCPDRGRGRRDGRSGEAR